MEQYSLVLLKQEVFATHSYDFRQIKDGDFTRGENRHTLFRQSSTAAWKTKVYCNCT